MVGPGGVSVACATPAPQQAPAPELLCVLRGAGSPPRSSFYACWLIPPTLNSLGVQRVTGLAMSPQSPAQSLDLCRSADGCRTSVPQGVSVSPLVSRSGLPAERSQGGVGMTGLSTPQPCSPGDPSRGEPRFLLMARKGASRRGSQVWEGLPGAGWWAGKLQETTQGPTMGKDFNYF